MVAVADVSAIKSLGDRPSMDLLVASAVGIWVTSKVCKGNGEGGTGGLKAPFCPPSDGTNTARREARALLNPAVPRANGARDGHQAKTTWRWCKENHTCIEPGLVLFPSSLFEQWVLASCFWKSDSSSAKWKKLKEEKNLPTFRRQESFPTYGVIINVKLFNSVMKAVSSSGTRVAGRSLSWLQWACINKYGNLLAAPGFTPWIPGCTWTSEAALCRAQTYVGWGMAWRFAQDPEVKQTLTCWHCNFEGGVFHPL